jgi:hypothetical protein
MTAPRESLRKIFATTLSVLGRIELRTQSLESQRVLYMLLPWRLLAQLNNHLVLPKDDTMYQWYRALLLS